MKRKLAQKAGKRDYNALLNGGLGTYWFTFEWIGDSRAWAVFDHNGPCSWLWLKRLTSEHQLRPTSTAGIHDQDDSQYQLDHLLHGAKELLQMVFVVFIMPAEPKYYWHYWCEPSPLVGLLERMILFHLSMQFQVQFFTLWRWIELTLVGSLPICEGQITEFMESWNVHHMCASRSLPAIITSEK